MVFGEGEGGEGGEGGEAVMDVCSNIYSNLTEKCVANMLYISQ